MSLAELLDALDYNQYPQYYLKTDVQQPPEIASLFRTARTIGVDGIYVFQTSPANPEKQHILPLRPAVYVAEAQTIKEAREIHRYLWNLGQAPFIIVVLPDHIRVYSGFDYSLEEDSILEPDVELDNKLLLKSPQREIQIIDEVSQEWVSEHNRNTGRSISIYHILLDCCP